jgi:glycosyltransferase involved in cell wall biosynthesis
MRVAFVIPGGGGGGVRSVLRVAGGLIERGHELTIYYRQDRSDFWDRLRRLYHALRYKRGRGWLGEFAEKTIPYRALTADVVGEHDVLIGVGVASVLEISGLPSRCGIKVNNSRGIEPWCLEEMYRAWSLPMPRIVVGSHLVKLMRQAGSDDPIFVAPNGIDAKDYFPSQPESARDGVGVVYHGAEVKDPQLIVGVLQQLARRRPQLPFYVFSTFPDPGKLPAQTRFMRFPPLAGARDLYSRSKVWFMASRNEGFGNPLLEAASCGCALVSTDCGGASDIIEHEKSGLIVPVGDADAMVSAIERLLDDEKLRRELCIEAMQTAKRFTWDHAIDAFERAVKAIASGSAAPSFAAGDERNIRVNELSEQIAQ